MDPIAIVGLDLAKRVFQVHGARADGSVILRKKLSRAQVLTFFAQLPPCVVAMEACASAHEWGRAIRKLGHEVRLIPPAYVKPFIKRQKNDAADAEAIAEAAARPTMRFVAVKSESQQARAMIFRTRDLLVRQRTQLINALRGHLAEHGVVAPQGTTNVHQLALAIDDVATSLDPLVVDLSRLYLDQIQDLDTRISDLEKRVSQEAKRTGVTSRLMTMPGIGPITAMAIETFAPPMETFKRGRDFAAWLGLVPRQFSSGGKPVLGRVSKMGQRDIRRLLIIGANDSCPVVDPQGRTGRLLAGQDAGAQAASGRRHRAGQQDGTRGLGDADEERELQGSGVGRGLIARSRRPGIGGEKVEER